MNDEMKSELKQSVRGELDDATSQALEGFFGQLNDDQRASVAKLIIDGVRYRNSKFYTQAWFGALVMFLVMGGVVLGVIFWRKQ